MKRIRGKWDWALVGALYVAAFAVSVVLYGWSAERLGVLTAAYLGGVLLRYWRPWRR